MCALGEKLVFELVASSSLFARKISSPAASSNLFAKKISSPKSIFAVFWCYSVVSARSLMVNTSKYMFPFLLPSRKANRKHNLRFLVITPSHNFSHNFLGMKVLKEFTKRNSQKEFTKISSQRM